ncbi:MAG TPA: hypothetical protein VN848_05770 [Gemmatimonadales bacterium]|nr:hypothetical protein [Gemmatimonadales bacterium]
MQSFPLHRRLHLALNAAMARRARRVLCRAVTYLSLLAPILATASCSGSPTGLALAPPEPLPPDLLVPTAIAAGLSFVSLSAGGDATCALTQDGTGYCWAGISSASGKPPPAPSPIAGLRFSSLSLGDWGDLCGVTVAEAAYCWGPWVDSVSEEPYPTAVTGGLSFAGIAVGTQMCGVTTSGGAYCWSQWNQYGQLGNDSYASFAPSAVSGGLGFSSIVTSNFYHTCALTPAGAAYCWGLNEFGQLGVASSVAQQCGLVGGEPYPDGGPFYACSLTPVPVGGGLSFASLATSGYFTCGLAQSGQAYCWGSDAYGELGHGLANDSTCAGSVPCSATPVAVAGGLKFVSLAAGFQHACGVTANGAAYCWGYNSFGQLGNGTTDSSDVPVAVGGTQKFTAIAAGHAHTCALTTTEAAYCWGATACDVIGCGGVFYDKAVPTLLVKESRSQDLLTGTLSDPR